MVPDRASVRDRTDSPLPAADRLVSDLYFCSQFRLGHMFFSAACGYKSPKSVCVHSYTSCCQNSTSVPHLAIDAPFTAPASPFHQKRTPFGSFRSLSGVPDFSFFSDFLIFSFFAFLPFPALRLALTEYPLYFQPGLSHSDDVIPLYHDRPVNPLSV